MRSRICVVFALASLACTTGPGSPDEAEAGDAQTSTDETETETGELAECESLDEADCNERSDCYAISGVPISADQSCREPMRFAFCSPQDDCNDAETNYLDPDGGCWWFTADCILDGGGWQSNSDQCPDHEEFQMLPECG